jgi:HEAT repeat protein
VSIGRGEAFGLEDFGPNAKPALPALIAFLNASPDDAGRAVAAEALAAIDPDAATKALLDVANPNLAPAPPSTAIDGLGSIGPAAKEAVPSLLQWATNSDDAVRHHAIWALGKIRAEPARIVPLLTNALHDPSPDVRDFAAWALEQFGPQARAATPALLEFLNASHEYRTMVLVTNALKQIDPEAAANAGVK